LDGKVTVNAAKVMFIDSRAKSHERRKIHPAPAAIVREGEQKSGRKMWCCLSGRRRSPGVGALMNSRVGLILGGVPVRCVLRSLS
jgi:hypothetical protein